MSEWREFKTSPTGRPFLGYAPDYGVAVLIIFEDDVLRFSFEQLPVEYCHSPGEVKFTHWAECPKPPE